MKKELQVNLNFRMWFLPIFLGLILILGVIFPYKGWWIILIALGLVLGVSFYSISHLKNDLEIQREMRYGWAKVGDVLEERIQVSNKGPVPSAWLEIMDHTNIPGHSAAIGTNIEAYGQTTWRTRQVCSRRGLFRIGPTTIQTTDLFGLYQLSIHDPAQVNILITPQVIPLPQITVASGGRTGDGTLAKGIIEQSVAVSTVREYQPQDPLHHIHWPLSAKHNELTTRVFDNTPTGNWWIIQDMNEKVQVGDEVNNSLEIGIILAASLAHKGIQSGKSVGFIANDRQHSWVAPQHTSDQSMKILRTLALSEAGNISLDDLLKKSRNSFHQTASLVIITPDLSLSWWKSLLWLKAKGMIPTILLLDPTSFGDSGDMQWALNKFRNANIQAYAIQAEMFADQISIKEEPLWEWRVFGTGQAIPIKKPKDQEWKRI